MTLEEGKVITEPARAEAKLRWGANGFAICFVPYMDLKLTVPFPETPYVVGFFIDKGIGDDSTVYMGKGSSFEEAFTQSELPEQQHLLSRLPYCWPTASPAADRSSPAQP